MPITRSQTRKTTSGSLQSIGKRGDGGKEMVAPKPSSKQSKPHIQLDFDRNDETIVSNTDSDTDRDTYSDSDDEWSKRRDRVMARKVELCRQQLETRTKLRLTPTDISVSTIPVRDLDVKNNIQLGENELNKEVSEPKRKKRNGKKVGSGKLRHNENYESNTDFDTESPWVDDSQSPQTTLSFRNPQVESDLVNRQKKIKLVTAITIDEIRKMWKERKEALVLLENRNQWLERHLYCRSKSLSNLNKKSEKSKKKYHKCEAKARLCVTKLRISKVVLQKRNKVLENRNEQLEKRIQQLEERLLDVDVLDMTDEYQLRKKESTTKAIASAIEV